MFKTTNKTLIPSLWCVELKVFFFSWHSQYNIVQILDRPGEILLGHPHPNLHGIKLKILGNGSPDGAFSF